MRKQLIILLTLLISLVSFSLDYEISDIDIRGNREVPMEVIKGNLNSKVGDKYSTNDMVRDYQSIKKLSYIDDVTIYPKLENNKIKLIIEIKEDKDAANLLKKENILPMSERVKVDKSLIISTIDIFGNLHISREEILEQIPVKVGSFFSKAKILEGQRKLINTGYFRDVNPEVYKYGEGVSVQYNLEENQVITGVKIEGNTKYSTDELIALIQTEPGKIYNINTLRDDKDRIIKKYHEDGYTLAKVINIDINNNMELVITLAEGIIRNVEYKKMVTKQKGARRQSNDTLLKTENFIIERELEIKEGQVFNQKDYDQTVRNLMRSGAFKNIQPEYKNIPGDPDGVKVVLLIDEDRTAMLQGAISYGSAVGLVGSVSIKDSNYKGRGQDLGFTFEKSSKDYTSVSLSFRDSWIKGTDFVSWGWNLYRQEDEDNETYDHYASTIHGGTISIGKGLSRYLRFELGLKLERVQEKNEDAKRTQDYNYASVTPSVIYDTRNNYLDPTSGNYAKFSVELGHYFGINAGSAYEDDPGINTKDELFSKATLELRKYHQGLFKGNTMAYRMVAGIGTDSLKYQQLYASGGANSMRGYQYGSFRGQDQLIFNIENRTEINEMLGLVFFYDLGRSWYHGDSKDKFVDRSEGNFPDDMKQSAGVGLRIKTPIGPIRLDFGFPVGDSEESGMQFFFNMGQMF
ncbi:MULTISPECIES: BamA/OMP85 family outer membrane protein [Psychrilyobacter]|uniref:Outer membrane protein assembly factor n=1 Tax=Psychrilyobacter piezotolerans TaxID=2293438 RepID=A0ABX9KEW4_9FUSO|nr:MULTISPECIES: BamA/TamA family outer membrane protein [Psychrilyobacter]MCS5421603.1 BamA/TamA family outer membrane protein [Psychrilyobacter sp. S5]NDI78175.1 BamA/TamA family outer membrane protein [Psychrilyobacter piezotolerans]RDE60133.1 outer membrane protein assembly factor [Psychrilyobacter sp. S5]REI40315.1 outer membrane protein assembly factor [Psychrilyobacter piezotolerans]